MDWMMNETEYREWCELSWEDRKARFLDGLFDGFAIPCDKSTSDGGTIRSEKVLKFCKATMRKQQEEERKAREKAEKEARYARLVAFYQNEDNIVNERSPFEEV